MVDTQEGRTAAVSVPRRVSSGPKLRLEFAEDFAGEDERALRPRANGGVRVTLPRGFAGTKLGRWVTGLLFVLTLGAMAVAAWMTWRYLLEDRRLFVPASASVEITGNQHLTRAQLLSVFGEDVDRNVLTVSLVERRAELERLPWVEHATVMRLLPHTLRVAIVERTPVAFYRQGGRIGMVDASGMLLDMRVGDGANEPRYSFPVLSGIGVDEPASTRAARMRIFGAFIAAMRGAGDGIAERLSEVDLSNPDDVKALIPVAGWSDILVHFGNTDFLERYRRFEENMPKWKAEYPKLASADMRYPRQVVLEMKPGTAVPVAGGTAEAAPAKAVSGLQRPHGTPKRLAAVRPAGPHLQKSYDVTVKPHTAQAGPR